MYYKSKYIMCVIIIEEAQTERRGSALFIYLLQLFTILQFAMILFKEMLFQANCYNKLMYKANIIEGNEAPGVQKLLCVYRRLQRHQNNALARHRRLQSLNKKIYICLFFVVVGTSNCGSNQTHFRSISKCFSNS